MVAIMFIVVLIHLIGFYKPIPADSIEINKCMDNLSCSCTYYGQYNIQCPERNPKISVLVNEYDGYGRIMCHNALASDYLELINMGFGNMEEVIFISCPLPTNGSSILSVLSRLGIQNTRKLSLKLNGSKETLIKQYLIGFNELEKLTIEDTQSLDMENNLFDDMGNLKWLTLRSQKSKLSIDIFQSLEKLEYISLTIENLRSLEHGLFRNQQKLKELQLNWNSLENLTKGVFQGASSILVLGLLGNDIKQFPDDVFAHLTNLLDVDLSYNQFTTLPAELFKFNKNLTQLSLEYNRVALNTLPKGFLSNLTNLENVNIIHCRLNNVPNNLLHGSTNIRNLSLAINELKSLPCDLFINQTHILNLDLSHNQLQEFDDDQFATTTSLEVLKLSFNNISKFSKTIFGNLRNLKELYLNNNKLIFIHRQTFAPISNTLGILQLEDNNLNSNDILYIRYLFYGDFTVDMLRNYSKGSDGITSELKKTAKNSQSKFIFDIRRLKCDCNIFYFIQYLRIERKKSVKNVEIVLSDFVCDEPEEMKGKPIKMIKSMNLLCMLDFPLSDTKHCPEPCNCKVRTSDKTMIINCSDTYLTAAPNLPIPKLFNLDSIELYIENSNITVLPSRANESAYNYVTKIFANNNQIASLLPENIPEKLTRLELTRNRLNRINSSVLETVFRTQTKLLLGNNPWICDCKTKDFLLYIQRHLVQIEDLKDIQCPQEHSLNELQIKDLCPGERFNISLTSIAIALLGLIIGILVAIYYKYQHEIKVWMFANSCCLRLITEEDLDKDKIYDAFISYSHKDVGFIVNEIMPYLEKSPHKYKLCLHDRDWLAGDYIQESIVRSVDCSRRSIIILSSNFLESKWATLEFRVAHTNALLEQRAKVILVIYGDIGDTEKLDPALKTYLKTNTYVKWGDPWFWKKLSYAMPRSKMYKGRKMIKNRFLPSHSNVDELEIDDLRAPPTGPDV